MYKGIVMEMTDKSIIVMREDGKFNKISRQKRSCEIGEEIIYADPGFNWASPSVAGRSAIVAAAVFCLVLIASFAGKVGSSEVVAYVSLDINPSVEMGIDEKEQVLELRGLNNDGMELIQTLNFKGKSLEIVTASLLDKAEQKSLAKGEADIVIASTVMREKSAINDSQIVERLRQQVTDHIKLTHPDQASSYQVEAFAAPQEVREEANKSGVSMGKYSVYLNAKSNGVAVTVEELRQESIHQIVKNNADDKSAVIQPDKAPTKDSFRKLVEEEKSGVLDKKIEEKKKEQSAKDNGKNNNSKTDTNKTVPNTSNNIGSTSNVNNNKDKNDDKNDDKKQTNTPARTNNSNSSTQPTSAKPGTINSGASRITDSKQDDNKNKDDSKKNEDKKNDDTKKDDSNQKADDKQKLTDAERRREEAKKVEEQKKREEEQRRLDEQKKTDDKSNNFKPSSDDNKKKDDSKKLDDNKKTDDQSKENVKKTDDRNKESDSKRDDNNKKSDDSRKDNNAKR